VDVNRKLVIIIPTGKSRLKKMGGKNLEEVLLAGLLLKCLLSEVGMVGIEMGEGRPGQQDNSVPGGKNWELPAKYEGKWGGKREGKCGAKKGSNAAGKGSCQAQEGSVGRKLGNSRKKGAKDQEGKGNKV